MVSLCEMGSDGRTAYERSRGKPCRKELPIFCECVFYPPLDRTRGRANKLEAKIIHGMYLGLRFGINEMYIGTVTGLVRGAAIKRKTEPQRFVWDVLNAIVGAQIADADARSTA